MNPPSERRWAARLTFEVIAMSVVERTIETNPENMWRLETPGEPGWERTARPGGTRRKYFMVSCDTHLQPPPKLFQERLDARFQDLLPRIVGLQRR